MVEAAARLAAAGTRLAITHQTGERDVELVRDAYRRAGLEARVEAFLFEMDREMTQRRSRRLPRRARPRCRSWRRRAGRRFSCRSRRRPTTTSARTPKWSRASGGAEVIDERELTGERLANRDCWRWRGDRERAARADGRRRSQPLARPDAAARIADRVWDAGGGSHGA